MLFQPDGAEQEADVVSHEIKDHDDDSATSGSDTTNSNSSSSSGSSSNKDTNNKYSNSGDSDSPQLGGRLPEADSGAGERDDEPMDHQVIARGGLNEEEENRLLGLVGDDTGSSDKSEDKVTERLCKQDGNDITNSDKEQKDASENTNKSSGKDEEGASKDAGDKPIVKRERKSRFTDAAPEEIA